MHRLNVRCCCQPQKILGTIELRSLERFQRLLIPRVLKASFINFDGDSLVEIAPSDVYADIKLRDFVRPWTFKTELAVYSDDRPIEFWRQFPQFREDDAIPSEKAESSY
jgi:hypothetical protein